MTTEERESKSADWRRDNLGKNAVSSSVMQWVSVSDRLPDTNCEVLVTKENGRVFAMSYHAPFDSGKRIFQWWGFGKWVDQHRQVTHWMYMPEPPIAQ